MCSLAAVVVGAIGAYAVLFGGLWFASFISAIVFQSTGEYFLMVQAQGDAEGREVAPPAWAQAIARAFCTLIPFLTFAASNRMKATLTGTRRVMLQQPACTRAHADAQPEAEQCAAACSKCAALRAC